MITFPELGDFASIWHRPRTTSSYIQKPKSATCFAGSTSRNDKSFALAGFSTLHVATERGTLEIVQLIFDRVRSPDPLTVGKGTPLCFACGWNTPDIGQLKLSKALLSQYGRTRKTFVSVPRFRCPWKTERRKEKWPMKFKFNLFSNIFPRKRS